VAGAAPVILDTCALLWVAQGGGALSAAALQRIDAAPVVYVSAISGFEIGIKVQKGKLHLPVPPADWFAAVLAHHNLEVLALDLAVCLRSTVLPAIHADPCDRMIIAAAQVYHMPVVTTDPLFVLYGIEVIS
jgi:PIN domain nuclease of toxin-antitoxin system